MKQEPLVTIITAVYNAEDTLEKSIVSVLTQTYKKIQYIIIDGGSTDGTVDIIKKYESSIFYWESEKDLGIYDAWNKGLKRAEGNWIAFLGADDRYLPKAIDSYIQRIADIDNSLLEYISSRVCLIDNNGKPLGLIGERYDWKRFQIYMNVAHVGSLHSKNFFLKYGDFNTSFKIVGDYEMLLRANSSLNAGFLDEITAEMRVGGVSSQGTRAFKEVLRAKQLTNARTVVQLRRDALIFYVKYYFRKILGFKY
ncbi:glycosyltransferase (plasmid) [Pedobacter sp. BS3]|uniref:glycosyltransferase family 2 protein n=1 Tax=Pedobacter sp. BS3 TaxID=2567937 RepID=UPI0011EDD819|nr:glycosyltransferase family 2 protein [Pedobacter sp. BS3]TZF86449.1 glycosyltransferase [Pedobacter sp. BS3]